MKNGYLPGYHYRSSKNNVNTIIESTPSQSSNDDPCDSQLFLASIQDQYYQILYLFNNNLASSSPFTQNQDFFLILCWTSDSKLNKSEL